MCSERFDPATPLSRENSYPYSNASRERVNERECVCERERESEREKERESERERQQKPGSLVNRGSRA